MAGLPGVFPHNHFVRTEHLTRALLLFVKTFDMAASYLNHACRYAVEAGLLRLPFDAHERYLAWRSALPADGRWASLWDGVLRWDTDVSSVIADFGQFLCEEIAGSDDEPRLLRDLVAFDLQRAMLNLRLRERNWDRLCASAPARGDDNPVTDPDEPVEFETRYGWAELHGYVTSAPDARSRPRPGPTRLNRLRASGPAAVVLVEPLAAGPRATEFPVFRQIEF